MGRRSHAQNLSHEPVMDVPDNGLLEGLPAITARHKLLTQSWAGDVESHGEGHRPLHRRPSV